MSNQILFEREWAMPNHKTFWIAPIKKLIKEERMDGEEFDAFPYPYKKDALENMKNIGEHTILFGLYDPPYSQYQLAREYENKGWSWKGNAHYFRLIDEQWNRIIKSGGKVIRCGWNSKRISKQFELTRILLVNHGASHNDTIVTVQKKLPIPLHSNGEGEELAKSLLQKCKELNA